MTDVEEIKIEHLDNKEPKYKKLHYPVPIKPHIQRPYFCALLCGLRGQGKTSSCVKMLKNAESGFIDPVSKKMIDQKVILFCPTIKGNPIWKSLKHLDDDDIHEVYTEAKLKEILEQLDAEREYTDRYRHYVEVYNKYIKMTPSEFNKWKDFESIQLLYEYDFADPEDMEKPKHPYGLYTHLIFDDCLANKECFNSKKGSLLTNLVLNGRHKKVSIYILCQHVKTIPKPIRENTEIWVMFKFKSRKIIIDHLYEHFGNLMTEDDFIRLYEYATANRHDAFVIDLKEVDEDNCFKKNFDVILKLK